MNRPLLDLSASPQVKIGLIRFYGLQMVQLEWPKVTIFTCGEADRSSGDEFFLSASSFLMKVQKKAKRAKTNVVAYL